jgi:hypothetical protein
MKTTVYVSRDPLLPDEIPSNVDALFPETCLHPKVFKDKLDSLIGKSFLTYHKDFLNLLGHYIEEGKIRPSDVEVIVLPDRKICYYDDDGYLVDYPIGLYSVYFQSGILGTGI